MCDCYTIYNNQVIFRVYFKISLLIGLIDKKRIKEYVQLMYVKDKRRNAKFQPIMGRKN